MKNLQSKLLILVAFLTFGLLITSCARDLTPEFEKADREYKKLEDLGASPEDLAEIQDYIDEARMLLDQGDELGALKKLEIARIRALELQGELLKAGTTSGPPPIGGTPIDIGLVDILFDYDQSRVRADGVPTLKQNAKIINDSIDRIKVVIVEGYCDTRGTDEYNLALGDKRAKSVMSYLIGIGVDPAMIESVGKGETDEWGADASESAYQKNRRAHFKVIAKDDSGDSMMIE